MGYTIKLLAIARRTDERHRRARAPDDDPATPTRSPASTASTTPSTSSATRWARRCSSARAPARCRRPRRSSATSSRSRAASRPAARRSSAAPAPSTLAVRDIAELETEYYVRLAVADQPGVLAAVATVFGDHGVSIGSVIQKRAEGGVGADRLRDAPRARGGRALGARRDRGARRRRQHRLGHPRRGPVDRGRRRPRPGDLGQPRPGLRQLRARARPAQPRSRPSSPTSGASRSRARAPACSRTDARQPRRARDGARVRRGRAGPSCAPRIGCVNRIPLGNGLGSSSAAIVGGLLLGERLAGADLGEQRLLELAAEIEGHPDNVAAALRRRLHRVLDRRGQAAHCARFEPARGLAAVVVVGDRRARDSRPRARCCPRRSRTRTPRSTSRTPGCSPPRSRPGGPELLGAALADRLHEPYRASAVGDLQGRPRHPARRRRRRRRALRRRARRSSGSSPPTPTRPPTRSPSEVAERAADRRSRAAARGAHRRRCASTAQGARLL